LRRCEDEKGPEAGKVYAQLPSRERDIVPAAIPTHPPFIHRTYRHGLQPGETAGARQSAVVWNSLTLLSIWLTAQEHHRFMDRRALPVGA
jgi:hypothetical protein